MGQRQTIRLAPRQPASAHLVIQQPQAEARRVRGEDNPQWCWARFSSMYLALFEQLRNAMKASQCVLLFVTLLEVTATVVNAAIPLCLALTQDLLMEDAKVLCYMNACLYSIFLVFCIFRYVRRLQGNFEDHILLESIARCLLTIHYTLISFITTKEVFDAYPSDYGIVLLIFFLLYGFVSEGHLLANLIFVCILGCIVLVEIVLRYTFCRLCKSSQVQSEVAPAAAIVIEIHEFVPSRYEQKACIICLTDFDPGTQIVQLPCHRSHIFHPPCLERWSATRNECPLCRAPLNPEAPQP